MLAEQFDAFLFDLDGVVYLGDRLILRAQESLTRLREEGKVIRFLTNDPRPTRAEVSHRLTRMGVEAHTEEVITSGWATAGYLRENAVRSAYVVGSPGLESEIRQAGVEVVSYGRPEAVVVGADERICYHHVRRAARLVYEGARFVATNPDGSFPTPGGPAPAAGAMAAAVAAAAGRRPDTTAGKPHPAMFEAALEGLDARKDRIAMVGVNPATDILGAHRAGVVGILVSSTETPVSSSARDFRAPDATIPDLSRLFDPGLSAHRWEEPAFPWPERVAAGVAAVVFDGAGRVLLGKRADNGLWGLPSGRVEVAETVEEAVIREMGEETGLKVEVERLVGIYSDPASQAFAYPTGEVVQFVTLCFRCRVVGGGLRADGAEATDVAFFDVDRLPVDLLSMHPRWLSDALSPEKTVFIR